MTLIPHLISHDLCPYVQRAVIVLLEKGLAHERTYIDLRKKPDWFTARSPLGRVPLLTMGDETLFESQVIAEYLDEITEGSLHPADPLIKARHRSWIEFGSETLAAIGAFYSAHNARQFEEKRLALAAKFARIDSEISGPFFGGRQFHMIDGVWGTIFRYLDSFDKIAEFELLTDAPNVVAWRELVSARPSLVTAVPVDYPERLAGFLLRKNSFISTLMRADGKLA